MICWRIRLTQIVLALVASSSASADDNVQQILSMPVGERVDAIADSLVDAGEPMSDKVLSYYLYASGVQGLTDKEGFTTQRREGRRMRLVTAKSAGYALSNFGDVVTLHNDERRTYFYNTAKNLVQVTVFTDDTIPVPLHLRHLTGLTQASCWRAGPIAHKSSMSSLTSTCDFYRTLEWGGVTDVEGLGTVLVLRRRRPLKNFRSEDREYFFGDRFNQLVFLGHNERRQSRGRHVEKGECISVFHRHLRLKYDTQSGYVLPAHLETKGLSECLDFDMQPIAEPIVNWDLNIRVLKSEVVDDFPDDMFQIDVPGHVRIRDLRTNR